MTQYNRTTIKDTQEYIRLLLHSSESSININIQAETRKHLVSSARDARKFLNIYIALSTKLLNPHTLKGKDSGNHYYSEAREFMNVPA